MWDCADDQGGRERHINACTATSAKTATLFLLSPDGTKVDHGEMQDVHLFRSCG